ncbi:MAG: TetR family transcriptional regulator [Microthrixaceae bacterium]
MSTNDPRSTSATATSDRLLDTAEFLFARSSIAAVTTREIVERAGQRNVSSISYYFGSREGLLSALLARRGFIVDAERGRLRSEIMDSPTIKELIECLVIPLTDLLHSPEGRSYIRIVAQLRGKFAYWRGESDASSARNMLAILEEIEGIPKLSTAMRAERVVSMIMLMTSSTGERARRLDEESGDEAHELSHSDYVTNLTAMCTAVLTA